MELPFALQFLFLCLQMSVNKLEVSFSSFFECQLDYFSVCIMHCFSVRVHWPMCAGCLDSAQYNMNISLIFSLILLLLSLTAMDYNSFLIILYWLKKGFHSFNFFFLGGGGGNLNITTSCASKVHGLRQFWHRGPQNYLECVSGLWYQNVWEAVI